jgi:hypothetical protein
MQEEYEVVGIATDDMLAMKKGMFLLVSEELRTGTYKFSFAFLKRELEDYKPFSNSLLDEITEAEKTKQSQKKLRLYTPTRLPQLPLCDSDAIPSLCDLSNDDDMYDKYWSYGYSGVLQYMEHVHRGTVQCLKHIQDQLQIHSPFAMDDWTRDNWCAKFVEPSVLPWFQKMINTHPNWVYNMSVGFAELFKNYFLIKEDYMTAVAMFAEGPFRPFLQKNFCMMKYPEQWMPLTHACEYVVNVADMHLILDAFAAEANNKNSLVGKLNMDLIRMIFNHLNIHSATGTPWSSFNSYKCPTIKN